MGDVSDVGISLAAFVAQWVYVAVDRPRLVARRPDRDARVDGVGIWALRSLVFGPLALPFYLYRGRRWPGAAVGLAIVAVVLFATGGGLAGSLGATALDAVLLAVAWLIDRRRWGSR